MIAGESIYLLPYLRKTFQTSMEVVFGLTSLQVGWLNTVFGILAVLCYFPSGWLADRISARKLLTFSLLSTSAGGFFMLTIPSYPLLLLLHALWGITSILTFWAALIKATRNWGNPKNQGVSFGLLDGGRGLVAAILASVATTAYALTDGVEESLKSVLIVYSLAPLIAGIAVWIIVPEKQYVNKINTLDKKPKAGINDVIHALKLRQVWLLSIIIFCAYMLYIGIFDFPAYAERTYGQTKTFGAVVGTIRDWMRPLAAIAAGVLADRFRSSRIISISFVLLVLSFGSVSLLNPSNSLMWILWLQVIISAIAVFSLRGIYFAIMEETGIPLNLTGITVGIVSFIGFSPDVFLHAISGWLVDSFPDRLGYRYYFGILSLIALAGFLASNQMRNYSVKKKSFYSSSGKSSVNTLT